MKLKCDILLSTSAFNFNLRRYSLGLLRTLQDGIAVPTSLDHLSEAEQHASMQKLRSFAGRESFAGQPMSPDGTDGRTGLGGAG